MFDIGFLELVLIAIISLLVLGPERLPVAARTAGRWVGKARRMVSQFSREIDRQLEIEELRKKLKEQGESLDITEDARNIHRTVQEALDEAKAGSDSQQAPDTHYAHESQPHGDFEPLPRDEQVNTIHPQHQPRAADKTGTSEPTEHTNQNSSK